MTAQRIEQLRQLEILACDTCAAYSALLDCIEHPGSWQGFDGRVRALKLSLDKLRAAVESEPVEVAAPNALSERKNPKQTTIEGT